MSILCIIIDAKLRTDIRNVLDNKYAVLRGIVEPEKTLGLFAAHLHQAGIIDVAITSNPTYHDIVQSFTAVLHVLTTVDEIKVHCKGFTDALRELGGTGATRCADLLKDEWETAINTFLMEIGHVGVYVCN